MSKTQTLLEVVKAMKNARGFDRVLEKVLEAKLASDEGEKL